MHTAFYFEAIAPRIAFFLEILTLKASKGHFSGEHQFLKQNRH